MKAAGHCRALVVPEGKDSVYSLISSFPHFVEVPAGSLGSSWHQSVGTKTH